MRFLAILVSVLVSFFIGLVLLGTSLNFIDVVAVSAFIQEKILFDLYSRIILGCSGVLVILFSLKYLQLLFFQSRKEKAITIQLPKGNASITLFAVEDMIRKFLEERKELSHIRPRVFLGKKGIEVVIRSTLTSEVNLIELTDDIQDKVKEKLAHLLGADKEINIRIEIKKMAFSGKKAKATEEEPEVPFRNY